MQQTSSRGFIGLFSLLTACAQASGAPGAPLASAVGVWLFDQPSHGEYEATEYSFFPGGQLTAWRVRGEAEVGAVSRDGVTCTFGHTWRGRDDGLVGIDGDCTDGRPREILLDLRAANAAGHGVIRLRSVGGQPGWTHEGWEWRGLRCGDAPGLRCPEAVEQGATLAIAPEAAARLPALTAACTSEEASRLVKECAMLGAAIHQDDRRTLVSLLMGEVDRSGGALSEAATDALARVDTAGGVAAWAGRASPTIGSDCLNCARSVVRVALTVADGSLWLLDVEAGHAPTLARAPTAP